MTARDVLCFALGVVCTAAEVWLRRVLHERRTRKALEEAAAVRRMEHVERLLGDELARRRAKGRVR